MIVEIVLVSIIALLVLVILVNWKAISRSMKIMLNKGKIVSIRMYSRTGTHFVDFLVNPSEGKFEYNGKTYFIVDNTDERKELKTAVTFDQEYGIPCYHYIESNPFPIHPTDAKRDVILSPELMDNIVFKVQKAEAIKRSANIEKKLNIIIIIGIVTILAVIGAAYYLNHEMSTTLISKIVQLIKTSSPVVLQ